MTPPAPGSRDTPPVWFFSALNSNSLTSRGRLSGCTQSDATRITAIGIAKSYCWECPKPTEFGSAGQNWENIGWRVNVSFSKLLNKIRPKDHMEVLSAVLPDRYSPLQANGNGIQSVYLTELSQDFAEVLGGLIGEEARSFLTAAGIGA